MGFLITSRKRDSRTLSLKKTALYLKNIGTLEQTFKINDLSNPKLEQKLEQLDISCLFGVLGKVKFYIWIFLGKVKFYLWFFTCFRWSLWAFLGSALE